MAHGALLRQEADADLASHVMHDYRNADLDAQTMAMLDYATKLTKDPSSMVEDDVKRLREHGLSDEQILSVVLITCVFNVMTRLADGLGVVFPQRNQEMIEGWLTGPATRQEWMMKQKG